ncbi:ABC transporter, ATP-binding protein [Marvinbryantia formatexigens DSM 14469]|uniref:ABC transporter, ATP-binding protein n=1 Tax=Marvinbryantia formatexigens DSM 14469 TaxID=478749 RepID=C6LHZ8_9FIRM|nr:ATP-binding cassette domain-containing protein [Marvinbryantia formatexigens]EET59653.1 ABC transporter, ATP-binding protein [Marvinbryantia formatexigens DSM 14469]UWO26684.1 ATP-binding cassette domain-containing protein [Marvinbryantia formatexigens DSM 14469]SDG44341.1 ABC-2 type transport system ATP-binding protein [Marvinbryantia formatexigens]
MSLVVRNLSKKYGDKTVVDNLNFEMARPGVFALLGTNGAGKTTSIRMMLNMLSRDSGEVLWNGKPLDTSVCNVGYLAEERGLYPKYTLMDQLIYFAALRGIPKAEAKKRIRYWAERLEVEEYLYPDGGASSRKEALSGNDENKGAADSDRKRSAEKPESKKRARKQAPKKADQLSKGNQQKIQFMTALLPDPDLLILDEPLSGLDPVNTDLFKSIIREEIAKGKYMIMSSHQMATVEEFCTDIIILNRSKTVLQGHLNDIKKSYGRINLSLKTETDVSELIEKAGLTLVAQKECEYQLRVSGEEQANAFLKLLIDHSVSVITFDLREPSLHEIFVEKVGDAHED